MCEMGYTARYKQLIHDANCILLSHGTINDIIPKQNIFVVTKLMIITVLSFQLAAATTIHNISLVSIAYQQF